MAGWDTPVDQGSSLNSLQIKSLLGASPLAPYADRIYADGQQYGVDPALFLAIAWFESHFGTASNSNIAQTFNWTSISNAAYGGTPVEGSRWGQYPTPEAGIDAFFKLITQEYYPAGQRTIGDIMFGIGGSETTTGQHAYAPAFENSVAYFTNFLSYINQIIGSTPTVVINAPPGTPQKPTGPIPGIDPFHGGGVNVGTVNFPAISVPAAPDIPGAIQNAGQGIVNTIQQALAPIVSGIANLNSLVKFIGDPKSATALLMIWSGLGITLLGIILFALSLIGPGTVRRVAAAAA